MVLQQTHSGSRRAPSSRLDPSRILGISSTLALNVLALLFLLMPMTLPSPPVVTKKPDIIVVDIVPLPPVTRPPPEIVPVTPPRPLLPRETRAAPAAIDAPAPVPVDQGPALPDTATAAAVDDGIPPPPGPSGPVVGMQLQYASATAPAYPRAAIQRDLEGTVLLRVLVDVDGRLLEVSIEKSSGHVVLDREALRHVQRHWTFRPALRDGQAVQAIGIVPIDFRLDRG